MHCNNYTKDLLNLQGVMIKKIENHENKKHIHIEMQRKEHECVCCGCKTNSIHDYRSQKIKDIQAFGSEVVLVLRKRRYCCTECGKRFIEKIDFLPKYYRMTSRLIEYIIDKLHMVTSFTDVAKDTNLSVSTVIRIFDHVSYSVPKKLPKSVAIDEFKGNTGGEKYNCILTDPQNHIVLDILPTRYKYSLIGYLKGFDKNEREKVNYFISDMWSTYQDLATTWLPNSTKVIDKYHWIRQNTWAFEKVRKEEQLKFNKTHRVYFKRSKSLLTKPFKLLTDEQKQQVNVMLYSSVNLSDAYFLKEDFLKILTLKTKDERLKHLNDFIKYASNSSIKSYNDLAKTMQTWKEGILNSLEIPLTNGFTEGCNNKIKVLKRNAYGYRNFKRFRNRIIHIFSNQ